MISITSKVVVSKHQVSCDLAGETAILGLKNGVYYGLNPVGARIWNLIQQRMCLGGIRDQIVREYDVDPGRCEADLRVILRELMDHELVEFAP
jgi:hypothetical protein